MASEDKEQNISLNSLIGDLYLRDGKFDVGFQKVANKLKLGNDLKLIDFEAFIIEVIICDAKKLAKKHEKEYTWPAKRQDIYLLVFGLLEGYYYKDTTSIPIKYVSLSDRRKKYILESDYAKLAYNVDVPKSDKEKTLFVNKYIGVLYTRSTRCKDDITDFLSKTTDAEREGILLAAKAKHIVDGKIRLPKPVYTLDNFPPSNATDIENSENKSTKPISTSVKQPGTDVQTVISEPDIISRLEELIRDASHVPDFFHNDLPSYTIDQIKAGVLGRTIVLNSICDNPNIYDCDNHDEHHFVMARKIGSRIWDTDTIFVEEHKIYEICIRITNDNPLGLAAIAENVTVFSEIPEHYAKTVPIRGCITSSNAKPKHYESQVYFNSRINFKLILIRDSIILKNSGAGKENGIKLSADLFNKNGTVIGYKLPLNGELPGGDEYSSFIIFSVKAIFDLNIHFTVTTKVRLANDTDKTWKKSVDAKVGDRVEFQINYTNTSKGYQNNVIIDDQLPANLRYVPGSTRIMNASFPQGATINEDDVTKTGIYIGNYGAGSNALIRFYADVVDDNFTCGRFTLRNWGRATVGTSVVQDSADVVVQLAYCPDPEELATPVDPEKPTEPSTPNQPST